MRFRATYPFRQVKALAGDDPPMAFEGYGSVFGNIDSYDHVIAKGAFTASLRAKRPKMLLQHGGALPWLARPDDLVPIGPWIDVHEDDHGLYCKGHLFDVDTDRIKAAWAAVAAGELDGLSIGYDIVREEIDHETGIRTLLEIDLWEISLVTWGANPLALIDRTKQGPLPSAQEFEAWLRAGGFPPAVATALLDRGYRSVRGDDATADFLASCDALAHTLKGV